MVGGNVGEDLCGMQHMRKIFQFTGRDAVLHNTDQIQLHGSSGVIFFILQKAAHVEEIVNDQMLWENIRLIL